MPSKEILDPANDWINDYEKLLESARLSGDIQELLSTSDNRRFPRISMISRPVVVNQSIKHKILNISSGGMSFHSEILFEISKLLTISLEGLLTIDAHVQECAMVETDPDFFEVQYQVHCQFDDERYGMRFLVLALQIESPNIGITAQ